jgi:hypothetical protein
MFIALEVGERVACEGEGGGGIIICCCCAHGREVKGAGDEDVEEEGEEEEEGRGSEGAPCLAWDARWWGEEAFNFCLIGTLPEAEEEDGEGGCPLIGRELDFGLERTVAMTVPGTGPGVPTPPPELLPPSGVIHPRGENIWPDFKISSKNISSAAVELNASPVVAFQSPIGVPRFHGEPSGVPPSYIERKVWELFSGRSKLILGGRRWAGMPREDEDEEALAIGSCFAKGGGIVWGEKRSEFAEDERWFLPRGVEEASLPLVEKAGEVMELGVASISVEPVISSNETTMDPPLARAVPGARLLSRSHFLIVEEFHLNKQRSREWDKGRTCSWQCFLFSLVTSSQSHTTCQGKVKEGRRWGGGGVFVRSLKPVSELSLCLVENHVLWGGPIAFLDGRVEMVEPSLTALFPNSTRELWRQVKEEEGGERGMRVEPYTRCNICPFDLIHSRGNHCSLQDLILILCPGPFVQSRLKPHQTNRRGNEGRGGGRDHEDFVPSMKALNFCSSIAEEISDLLPVLGAMLMDDSFQLFIFFRSPFPADSRATLSSWLPHLDLNQL